MMRTDLSQLLSAGRDLDGRALDVALYAVDDFPLLVDHSGEVLDSFLSALLTHWCVVSP